MPIVEVNGQELEFPDDMSPDQIKSVLRQKFPMQETQAAPTVDNRKQNLVEQARANARNPAAYAADINAIAKGVLDLPTGITQFAPRALQYATSLGGNYPNVVSEAYGRNVGQVDETVRMLEKNYRQQQQMLGRDPEAFDTGRLIGNVANPANYLIPVPAQSAGLVKRGIQGAAGGSVFGLGMPVENTENYAAEKTRQVQAGALGGAGGQVVSGAIGRVLNPQSGDKAVQQLLKENVQLTPGEILGGAYKRAEDALSSIPLVGAVQKSAKQTSSESFNRATVNKGLRIVGEKLPDEIPVGYAAVGYMDDVLDQKYKRLLPKLQAKVDKTFGKSLTNLTKMVNDDKLTDAVDKEKFNQIIQEIVVPTFGKSGVATGAGIKKMQEELRRYSQGFSASSNPSQRQIGTALGQLQQDFRKMLMRVNPKQAEELGRIDSAYFEFKRIQEAAAKSNSVDGVFTPTSYNQAFRSADKSKDKAKFARGAVKGQEFATAAKKVLPAELPNAGTADRLLMAAGLGGLASAGTAAGGGALIGTQTGVDPYTAAGIGLLLSSLYTRPGLAGTRALLTSRPESVRSLGQAISAAGRFGTPATAIVAAGGGN